MIGANLIHITEIHAQSGRDNKDAGRDQIKVVFVQPRMRILLRQKERKEAEHKRQIVVDKRMLDGVFRQGFLSGSLCCVLRLFHM